MPRIIVGDCFKVLPTLEPDSVDACVTDPPYGIGFMGKKWDNFTKPVLIGNQRFQSWCTAWSIELYRVLKPGGYLLAFGGTRTSHRLTCALENAGFEIRDCLMWLHGQGFPKSLDVSKAIDKAAGATRRVIGTKLGQPGYSTAPSKGRGSYNAAVDGSWQDSERELRVLEEALERGLRREVTARRVAALRDDERAELDLRDPAGIPATADDLRDHDGRAALPRRPSVDALDDLAHLGHQVLEPGHAYVRRPTAAQGSCIAHVAISRFDQSPSGPVSASRVTVSFER